MNDVDSLLAKAQVWLASLMALGFLALIFVLIVYHATLDDNSKALLTGLAGVLGTIVTQQSGYFFARQRPATPIDGTNPPNPPTITAKVQP